MKIFFVILYILIFISITGVLLIINTPKDTIGHCKDITVSIAPPNLQKYTNYIEVPKNTLIKVNSSENSQSNKRVAFTFTYQYPNKLLVNYEDKYHTINLKKNKTKKLILKITNSKTSKTYYRFLVRYTPKKSVSLQSDKIVILKQESLENPYLLNKLMSKYHKIIIQMDSCKTSKQPIVQRRNTENEIQNTGDIKNKNMQLKESSSQTPSSIINNQTPKPNNILIHPDTKTPSVFVILDKSGSLNEFDRKPLKLVKSTISNILDTLTNKNAKLTIGAFDDNKQWLFENIQTSEVNLNLIKNFLNNIYADGGTNLYKILESCSHKETHNNLENYLIVITDGFVQPANFQKVSKKLRKKFKNIIIIGAGIEINVEFVNHLANLLKGNLYLITDENDLHQLPNSIKKLTANLPITKITNNNLSNNYKEETINPNTMDTSSNIGLIQFSTPISITQDNDPSIHFTKLYVLDKNNVYNFKVNSTICGSFLIDGFKPFGYNEFLQNILFKSVDFQEKIILSVAKIDSLFQNPYLKKKMIDILYNNYAERFTKNSEEIFYRKTYHSINIGNHFIRFTFSKFKHTNPSNSVVTINNCPNKNIRNYNTIYSLWLSLSIIILAGIKIIWG